MNQTTQQQRRVRPKGRYKLAIFFIDHRIPSGKPCYHYSTPSQDKYGKSLNRLKYLINGGYPKYAGKVDWAAIYENGQMVCEFKDHKENHERFWLPISSQAS